MNRPVLEVDRLYEEIRKMRDEIKSLQQSPFHIPLLNSDPEDTDNTTLWQLTDGRVRTRLHDGSVVELATTGYGKSPRGLLGRRTNASGVSGTGAAPGADLTGGGVAVTVPAGRSLAIRGQAWMYTPNGNATVALYRDGTQLVNRIFGGGTAPDDNMPVDIEWPDQPPAGTHTYYMRAWSVGGNGTDPNAGRTTWITVTDEGELDATAPSGPTSSDPVDFGESPELLTWERTATWTQSFRDGGGTQRHANAAMYYGDNDDEFGYQVSQFGFDNSAAAQITTGRVRKIELYVSNIETQDNLPIFVAFDTHNYSTPTGFYFTVVEAQAFSIPFTGAEEKWVEIPLHIAEQFRTGAVKGFGIHQLDPDPAFYGYADGTITSDPPKIRITYVR